MSVNQKKALFEKMKAENLFWSYAKDVAMEDVDPDIFIETVLKYGDVDDIRQLKNMFADGEIREAWAKRVMFDSRFDGFVKSPISLLRCISRHVTYG